MSDTFLAISFSSHGTYLCSARRFTADEKSHYVEWYRETGMISLGSIVKLPEVTLRDAPNRPSDGNFNGSWNQAYIISQDEWDAYIALNDSRALVKAKAKEAETRRYMLSIIEDAQVITPISREEAQRKQKAWINVANEGGEGYVPHYLTTDDVERAKQWLADHPE